MRDARRCVGARHGPVEQQISGLRGCSFEQPSPLALIRIMQWRFQEGPHHAIGEVTLPGAGGGATNLEAGAGGANHRLLDERRLSEPGGRDHRDDPAGALLQLGQGGG